MIWAPKLGQRVRIHYAKKTRMPYQDALATIMQLPSRGKGPRNALVQLEDGRLIIVSRGNLVVI